VLAIRNLLAARHVRVKKDYVTTKELQTTPHPTDTEVQEVELEIVSSAIAPAASLQLDVSDVALNYFMNQYIPTTQHFAYLPKILDQHAGTSTCIVSASHAAALANLARERQDHTLHRISRKAYSKAIKDINAALHSSEAVSASTLIAVLVMGLFEAISFEDTSLESWMAHTNGTLDLLSFRCHKLLHTALGKKIFVQIANYIRLNCTQQRTLLPQTLLDLEAKMMPLLDEEVLEEHPIVPFWEVGTYQLRYMTNHPELFSTVDAINYAMQQETLQLELMEKTQPVIASYGLSFHHAPDQSFRHVAHDVVRTVRFMMTVHVMRLVRSEIVFHQASVLRQAPSTISNPVLKKWCTDRQREAERNARASADGMLVFLPFYLYPDSTNPTGPLDTIKVSQLVWPLSCFEKMTLITPMQRERARDALSQIGQRAKLPIATAIANSFNTTSLPTEQVHMIHAM
jgi:Fungal specific transcription factor domain